MKTKQCLSTRYSVGCGYFKPIGDFFHGGKSGFSTREHTYCRECRDLGTYQKTLRNKFAGLPPKECPACGMTKGAYDFGKKGRRPDGLHCRCKACRTEGRPAPRPTRSELPEGHRRCSGCRTVFLGGSGYCGACKSKREKERRLAKTTQRCSHCRTDLPRSAFSIGAGTVCWLCVATTPDRRRVRKLIRALEGESRQFQKRISRAAAAAGNLSAEEDRAKDREMRKAAARAAELAAGRKLCRGTKRNPGCGKTKPLTSFGMIESDPCRRVSRCGACQRKTRDKEKRKLAARAARKRNPAKFAARKTLRELRQLHAAPKWLTQEQRREIFQIYEARDALRWSTGVRHHVDHIIPLRGREEVRGHVIEVWGLHVPWNLRAIPGKENMDKSNKFLKVSEDLFAEEYSGALVLDANANACEPVEV